MLYSFTNLRLPSYSSLKEYEGKGNYAISKYYKFPYSIFYRHKLKMILDIMEKDKIYHNILDYGSGPGIFTPALKQHTLFVKSFDINDVLDTRWRYDAVVCSSFLEFSELPFTLDLISKLLNPGGKLYVGSPMETGLTKLYFKSIGDKNKRHGHNKIMSEISKKFRIETYNLWMNLYFALRASKK